MRFRLLSAVLLPLFASTPAVAHDRSAIATEPATLWYSEQFTLHSKSVGRDFLIQVARPAKPVAGKTPAVFLLDGNTNFGLAAPMIGLDDFGGTFEPAFVVAIGYKGATKAEWDRLRAIDLTHVVPPPIPGHSDMSGSFGGGAAFEHFLTTELRPLIEARYQTDPHRAMLVGHSFGGLFAAHVLLNHPDAFDAFMIGSPSLWADPDLLRRASFFIAPTKKRVFLAVGAEETLGFNDEFHMVGNVGTLAALLTGHFSNTDLKLEIVPGESHVGVIPIFLEHGFRFVLPAVPAAK
jgi:predicted alpha/beta superfamily hydrolase